MDFYLCNNFLQNDNKIVSIEKRKKEMIFWALPVVPKEKRNDIYLGKPVRRQLAVGEVGFRTRKHRPSDLWRAHHPF